MSQISVGDVGILLPEFPSLPKRYSLEEYMREMMISPNVSKGARKLLESTSPSRSHHDGNMGRLILVEGKLLPKDPHTEAVNRFAKAQGWSKPSLEDLLRIYPVLSARLFPSGTRFVVALHTPIKDQVLGFTLENNQIILSAHKAEPREGWFCRNGAFIFRLG